MFHVEWTHVKMKDQAVTSELDKFIQKELCSDAGKGVELQCTREYWAESDDPWATQLFRLTAEERKICHVRILSLSVTWERLEC